MHAHTTYLIFCDTDALKLARVQLHLLLVPAILLGPKHDEADDGRIAPVVLRQPNVVLFTEKKSAFDLNSEFGFDRNILAVRDPEKRAGKSTLL